MSGFVRYHVSVYIVIEPNKKAMRIAVPFNDFPSASIGCRIFIKDKVA
jgi:hypothetical protein